MKTHGVNGYRSGCRCEKCIEAYAKYRASSKDSAIRRLKQLEADPNDDRHGTSAAFSVGCKCEKCRKAQREYFRKRRMKERVKKDEKSLKNVHFSNSELAEAMRKRKELMFY